MIDPRQGIHRAIDTGDIGAATLAALFLDHRPPGARINLVIQLRYREFRWNLESKTLKRPTGTPEIAEQTHQINIAEATRLLDGWPDDRCRDEIIKRMRTVNAVDS